MKLGKLLEKIDMVSATVDMGIEVTGVSFDTRTLRDGEVFVAVRGFKQDGHRCVADAVAGGASCIICEDASGIEIPYVVVKDSRKALALASASWFGYPAEKLIVIGVTGTNGKTTVTTLIKQVIENCTAAIAGLIGTNVNMIGDRKFKTEHTTPGPYEIHSLLAQMVEEGCKYVVMEVTSHALEQNRVYGIEFDVGVYTNLSPDHLDYHASMEEYAQVKSHLFKYCKQAAINIDDEYAPVMVKNACCPVFTYAVNNGEADLIAKNIKLHEDCVDFSALSIGNLNRVELGIPGMFSVYNALAVLSASLLAGFNYEKIINALKNCAGVKGRAEFVPTGQEYSVLIDYAHTPDALENIITAFREFARGRIVTLFGCGGDRDKTKRSVMGGIAAKLSDFVIVTSDNPRTEEPGEIIKGILVGMEDTKTPYTVIENRREAIYWALDNARKDDILILAGKGHETYQILGTQKIHFDEREVIKDYLSAQEVSGRRVF